MVIVALGVHHVGGDDFRGGGVEKAEFRLALFELVFPHAAKVGTVNDGEARVGRQWGDEGVDFVVSDFLNPS